MIYDKANLSTLEPNLLQEVATDRSVSDTNGHADKE
jgi:hypothetical protein